MGREGFDYTVTDAQATRVEPVKPADFDFDAFADYEASLLERCRTFWAAESGVLVYRRMRVAEVFSYGCKDMKASLEWQLGALKQSMAFEADVPNFLEPWYGIGTIAGAFGVDYTWKSGQAPAIRPVFQSVAEALDYTPAPVAETAIGQHTLRMIDYFLDKTGGKLPMSVTDTQSPLNIACNLVDMTNFFVEMLHDPGSVKKLLDVLAELLAEFTKVQVGRIDDRIVWPGHGFASCRCFEGLGISDDNALMISNEHYLECAAPAASRVGEGFGGLAFHSCGDWAGKIETVKQLQGLRVVDGAFSAATDPSPNPAEPFQEAFANTGLVVNARIVGRPDLIAETVRALCKPGMKLIVVTYCRTPEEQKEVFRQIHEICGT